MILTGATDTENKVRCLDAGAIDYVTKPFDPAELRARCRVGLRLHRYQELLTRQARIDALTGCWNRGFMEERLLAEVATAWRYGRPVGFVLVDVDHFQGDQRHARPRRGRPGPPDRGPPAPHVDPGGDTVGRFGGDEFALVVRETLADGMERFVERLAMIVGEHAVDAGKGGPACR